jgi:hypothetical protein
MKAEVADHANGLYRLAKGTVDVCNGLYEATFETSPNPQKIRITLARITNRGGPFVTGDP